MADIYFALKPGPEAASDLLGKTDSWVNVINSSGYLDKLKASWASYYGAYFDSMSDGHQVVFTGEQGELVALAVNHYRNIAQHTIQMITANRPAMDARAINTDYKSIMQAKLANGILDYYVREKRLEIYLKQSVEHAVVLGAGFIKLEWDANAGEVYDYMENDDGTPDHNRPIYDGDIEFTNISPFDIVMDGSKESANKQDWYIVRSWKNKYDLAAQYPELSDKILGLETKSDIQRYIIGIRNLNDNTEDVAIYEFYHRKTDCLPNGRYMLYLDQNIVLQDIGLPYRVMPIFRISAGDIMGTPYGYSAMFDALPLQEALNSLYSSILTNQNAFGVQNVWMKPGDTVDIDTVFGGMNLIKSETKPESINLTESPKEIFDFINILKADMETITGVNSVTRGDPQASLRTGAALALVQSMSLQFMSGLQQSYVELIENIGTSIIQILQDYAKTPRLAAIVGKTNRTALVEFEGKDISNITRVYVDVGNPLAKTIAGKMELASQMLQYQVIKNPNQIIQVLNTGTLDVLDEDVEGELNLIREENEALMDGETPKAIAFDDHKQHIWEHRKPLQDPELRKDPELLKRVFAHVQQHVDLLHTTDPQLLQLIMQQPLPPENQPPTPPQGPPPLGPPQGPPGPQGQAPHRQQHPHGPLGPTSGHNMSKKVPFALLPPAAGQVGPQFPQQGGIMQAPNLGQGIVMPNPRIK